MQVGGGRRPPPLPRVLRNHARLHSRRGSVVGDLLRSGGVAGKGGDGLLYTAGQRQERRPARLYLRRGGCPRRAHHDGDMDGMTARERHADKYIFIACLVLAAALFVGGFFCPPMGVIDGSVLKAAGILLGFATLGVAGQNLANGKDVIFTHGDTKVEINDEENE